MGRDSARPIFFNELLYERSIALYSSCPTSLPGDKIGKRYAMQERRLVRFLDSIKTKAAAVYLLGDMFDFWNEYKYVVPKGYTRFLGRLSFYFQLLNLL